MSLLEHFIQLLLPVDCLSKIAEFTVMELVFEVLELTYEDVTGGSVAFFDW